MQLSHDERVLPASVIMDDMLILYFPLLRFVPARCLSAYVFFLTALYNTCAHHANL